jgi:2-(1,2-epoxy-1,2-dihydrophenyl)acetyl-CoA isomerase
MSFETLRWELADQVATITLDRPEKKNAMSWVMFREIREAFERAASDDEVRCVVLTGAGGAFCSGADLTDPDNMVSSTLEMRSRMDTVHEVARAFLRCSKPTIARVDGIAAGAGCNLALGCDFVIASRTATFAELFVKRGLVVDFGGTWVLSRGLGLHRAKQIAMLGETFDAIQADRWGLLYRLCEPDELDAEVKGLAARLCSLPPKTLAMIKDNLDRAYERSIEDNLTAESIGQTLAIASEDTKEAVLAWIEKREPRFTGR